jgi:hypothetical protein
MATHNMYCVGLKRKVDATVDGVTHMVTSKGSKYQIKGHYMDGGKKYNCTSMCSKAVHDSMKAAGVTAATKNNTLVLDAEPKLGSGKRFDELSEDIAEEYEKKGKSPEEAEKIGDATAAVIGMKKYGKKKMAKLAKMGAEGDGVETPTEVTDIEEQADVEQPEVDNAYTEESGETIAPSVVEQSSVSATADSPQGSEPMAYDPTAETPMDDGGPAASFSAEAFGGDLASLEDFDGVESVVVEAPLGHGVTQYYAEEGEPVVADPSTFPAGSGHVIGSQTADANYTPLHAEDATAPEYDPLSETPGPHLDESAPSEHFEAMAVYQSGPGDVNKGMAALINGTPYTLARGNFIAYGPKYYTMKEGVSTNKYHLFTVLKLDNGMFMPANAYGRIGYGARTWYGPAMSSESGAIREIEKKVSKKTRKGYDLEFGAEESSAPMESHPLDYDPLTASPSGEGGPDANFGWSEADADAGAFSAEFIANAEDLYCAECFEASCGGHDEYEAEDGPSPLDYDPLTAAPSGEGGPPAGPSDSFEADGSGISMAAGVGLVVGLIAAYKYSDKISDLFRQLGDE